MQSNKAIQEIRTALKSSFKEREALVDGMLTAILAREMLFVLGPPGTAKSAICEALSKSIGGTYFSWLISKFTTPEELFGPISFSSLQNNKFERVVTAKLPEAHVAFLDEIFKGSSAILNTLLSVINERVFFNNGRQQIPLQVLFGASNELPTGEELAPLYDRFVLRYVVDRMKSDASFRELLEKGGLKTQIPTISLAELEKAQKDVEGLPLSSDAIQKMLELRKEVDSTLGIYVSDRKWMQSIRVVKAYAYLHNHNGVEVEDLTILENVLWSQPDQIPQVRSTVRKLCNPIADKLQKHLDAANEVFIQWQNNKTNAYEAFKKLKGAREELDKLTVSHPTRKDLQETLKTIISHQKTISAKEFGGDI